MIKFSYIVYLTTNLINGKIYVGQTTRTDPNYIGSGVYFKSALKKYGKENFIRVILEYCNNLDKLNKQETFWILKFNPTLDRNIGYNLTLGGNGSIGYKHTEKTKQKISQNNTRYWKGKKNQKNTDKK